MVEISQNCVAFSEYMTFDFDPPFKKLNDRTDASKYRCVSLGLCRRVGHGVNALWEVSFTLFYSNAAVEAALLCCSGAI